MKKIGIEDLFKEIDIFKKIRESADQTITKLNQMHESSVKVAKALNDALGKNKMDSSKSINELNKAQEKSNKLMLEAIKIENLKKQAQQNSLKVTQQIEKLEQEYQKRLKETASAEREATRTKQEKVKLEREELKLSSEMSREEEKKAKAQARAEKLAKQEASAYSQLAKVTRDLKNQSKDLASQMLTLEMNGKKNSAQYQQLATKYRIVTAEAQKFDQKLKSIDKNVGDNFRNVGNYAGAISKLQNVMGAMGVAFGVGQIVRNVGGAVADFEVQNSKLASVLGTTTDKTKSLQNVQRELGRSTNFTAGEVAQLQVELAKLGFTTPEIENSSEAILKLAGATGTELARASEVAGSTLRGFSLDSSKMTHVADVMAKSFSTSALDMESFAESMKYVAPISKLAGVSIEETSAMLGVLANQGIKGSQAGTSLRRIFTDMARTGKPVKEALAEVTANGIALTDAFDEVGRTAMTSLAILGNNTSEVDRLAEAYRNADGSVNQMYATMTDNLQGAFDRLSSAWESYWLDANESSGASKTLTKILDFLANNLVTILNLVFKVVRAWLTYKTTIMVINTYNRLALMGFSGIGRAIAGMIPTTRAYRLNMLNSARATQQMALASKSANLSQKALKTTMMGTPWGLIAVGVTEVAFALYDYFSASKDAEAQAEKQAQAEQEKAEAIEKAKQEQEEETKAVSDASAKFVDLINKLRGTNANSKERLTLMRQINNDYGTTLKNLSDESKFQQQLNAVVHEYIEYQKIKYRLQKNEGKISDVLGKQLTKEEELAKVEQQISGIRVKLGAGILENSESFRKANKLQKQFEDESLQRQQRYVAGSDRMRQLDDESAKNRRNISEKELSDWEKLESQANLLRRQISGFDDDLMKLTKTGQDLQDGLSKYKFKDPKTEVDKMNGSLDQTNGKAEKFQTTLKQVTDYLSQARKLSQELLEIDQTRQVNALTEEIDDIIKKAQEKSEQGSQIILGVRLEKPKVDAQGNFIEDEDEVRKRNLEKLISANSTLNEKIEERARLEKEVALQRANFEKETIELQAQKEIEEERNKLLEERDKLLKQEGIDQSSKQKIFESYDKRLEELDIEEKERAEDVAKQKQIIDEKYLDEAKKIDESITENKKTENEKVLKDFDEANKKKLDKAKKTKDEELELEKKRQKEIQEVIKASSEYFIKKSEEKIAQLDKEIAKAEENQSALEELAKNGNIQAQQSLAENQKIIDEANKKKLQEQKKQEKIKLVESALTTYSQKVESGSETPLADTIKDITLLTQFINSLPAFFDGTEDTGSNGRGVDGRGGFHAVLHPNERVIPKSLNEQIGNLSNEQLTKLAVEYQNMKVFNRNDSQIGSAMDTAILVQKLDNLTKVIENKPEHHFEIGQITQTFFEMIEKTKKGNTTIFNKYKVKR